MSTLKSRPVLILIAGFLVLFIGGGARLAIGLTLKPMVEELGWGRSELGVTVAVFQVVTAIAMFYAGKIADTMSLRLVLGGGVALGGLTIGAMCLVTQPWHAFLLYGVAFAIGNGVAATTPVAVMVTRAYPHKAGMANAIALGGMSVGQLVVVAVLAAVMVSVGWRSVYIWVGAAHFVLIPLILAPGAGSELYRGLGAVMGGGLLVSTVFTIVVVPLVMAVLVRDRPDATADAVRPDASPAST
jgi:MFS family permease